MSEVLTLRAAPAPGGTARGVKSAYIAGVIPDDDSFWEIAKSRGFTVRRGFLGSNSRSKQDDAYLITDMTSTLYEEEGPSTIVLVAGDADYVPPLRKAVERRWRTECAFINRGGLNCARPSRARVSTDQAGRHRTLWRFTLRPYSLRLYRPGAAALSRGTSHLLLGSTTATEWAICDFAAS